MNEQVQGKPHTLSPLVLWCFGGACALAHHSLARIKTPFNFRVPSFRFHFFPLYTSFPNISPTRRHPQPDLKGSTGIYLSFRSLFLASAPQLRTCRNARHAPRADNEQGRYKPLFNGMRIPPYLHPRQSLSAQLIRSSAKPLLGRNIPHPALLTLPRPSPTKARAGIQSPV